MIRKYLDAGFKAIKCKGYNPKVNRQIKGSDAAYKEAKAALTTGFTSPDYVSLTKDEIIAWELSGGWIGWVIPAGIIALDVEESEDIEFIKTLCAELGIAPAAHKTTNGYHFLFRASEDIKAQTKAGINCGLEVTYRVGGKNYLILAPTLGRSWERWTTDLPMLPEEFKPSAAEATPQKDADLKPEGNRPGDQYAEATAWRDILEPYGWTYAYTHGGVEHWRRPGKEAGSSATIGHHGTDYFHCFTDAAAFDPDKSYSKFAVYAILNHAGDFKAAAAELSRQGFGEPTTPVSIGGGITLEQEAKDWISGQIHKFRIEQCQRELCAKEKHEFLTIRKVFNELYEQGVIDFQGGLYCIKQNTFNLINPKLSDILPIDWPLNLQEITQLKPKELMTVAGVYGAGKTAFCLNLAQQNIFLFKNPVRYIASELNEHDLAWKLKYLPALELHHNKRVLFIERLISPWELIDPDALNIIDYLERHDDFFSIGADLAKCQAALKTGVVIVCLQKNPGADTARGGAGTMQKPALVLNLEQGEAQIKKARYWADPSKKPLDMKINFQLKHSVIFETISGWYTPDQEEIYAGKRRYGK